MKLQTKKGADNGAIQSPSVLDLLNARHYPIDRPQSPTLRAAAADARAGLSRDGCARIGGFIDPAMHTALAAETTALATGALYSTEPYTPYGRPPDLRFPKGHPQRRTHRTTSGNVTRDLIPEDSLIQKLYRHEAFKAFIATCLEAEVVHEFADPMRGLIINSMPDGTSLGWHFDANEFVVSLMTRRAKNGGAFEYCPGIRAPGDENYATVKSVLDGERDRVMRLDLRVGDLQIFKGRYSMHRVAPVGGVRHTVIFGYDREPGFIGSVASTLRVYGRAMQAHIEAEGRHHADGLAD